MKLQTIKSAYRRTWTISPVQRVTGSKKLYKRQASKREARQQTTQD